MRQLRVGVVCLGFAQALLLFVPREFGGWIGVVTLVVAGTVLAMTAPLRGTDDTTICEARSRLEAEDRSSESDDSWSGRHSATSGSLDDEPAA